MKLTFEEARAVKKVLARSGGLHKVGAEARLNGAPLDSCPFTEWMLRVVWERGWKEIDWALEAARSTAQENNLGKGGGT
jgi:ribosome modulation factor